MALAESSRSAATADTRQRLLAAAVDVFLEKGYDGTRVAEIAKRAGMTTGAIYANFDGKSDLLGQAIVAAGAPGFGSVSRRLGASVDLDAIADVLAAGLTARGERHHRLALDLLAAAPHDDTVRPHAAQRLDATDEFIATKIDEAKRAGSMDAAVDGDALRTVIEALAVGSLVTKALGRPTASRAEVRALLTRLFSSLAPDEAVGPHRP